MDRRRFLVAGAAGASALAAPAVASGKTEWAMVMPWPRNTPGVGVNAERLARRITAMSDGRLNVRLFAGGELVPPFESLDAVQAGSADMVHGTPYYWAGKARALHAFTTVPFGLTANEHAAWLRFGDGQALWDEIYASFGLKPFYAGNSGIQAGGWFRREIVQLEDFAGLKIRMAGFGGEVLRRAGAVVVQLPPGEIVPAMQSGAIDAAEWVGPWNDLAFGLPEVAPYYYVPAFHEPGAALELTVNKARYDALPADLQAIVAAAAAATAHETLADFTFHNVATFGRLAREHAVALRAFPDEVIEGLGRLTRAALADLAAGDEDAGRVLDSYTRFLAQADGYAQSFDAPLLRQRRIALSRG